MRWQFKGLIVAIFGLAMMSFATGQQPLQINNFRSLFGKDGKSDAIGLLKNRDVKNELKLTDEQLHKVEDAIWKMLAETLDPEQVKRLYQIDLQQRDYKVFIDPKVKADLKLTESQVDVLQKLIADYDGKIEGLMKELESSVIVLGGQQNTIDRINNIRKEAKENCTEVLEADQRRVWIEMLGDHFVFSGSIKVQIGDGTKKGDPGAKGAAKKAKKGG